MTSKSPSYISALVTPGPGSNSGRKSWSIDVESIWVPFFTATNAMGDTNISPETLGAPIRLATDKAGAVRFSPNGRPSLRIAPDLTKQIRIVRENFVASLQQYTGTVIEENGDAYRSQVEANQAAATPFLEQDTKLLQEELDRQAARAADETPCQEEAEAATARGRKAASKSELEVELEPAGV